jgi:hypothetical protein
MALRGFVAQRPQSEVTQLAECDTQIQAQLQALHVREDEPAQGKKRASTAST